jgi:hypothetical protein
MMTSSGRDYGRMGRVAAALLVAALTAGIMLPGAVLAASPTVTINQAAAQADPTGNPPINFTVVFSESVTGFTTGDVDFTGSTAGGTLVGAVSGSGTTYNVAVTGMTTNGTVVANVPAGVAQNGGAEANVASTSTDNSVTWNDTTAPSVTINEAAAQADPTGVSPINFTVVFSEPVSGFATGDVTISGTAGGGGSRVGTVSGSGTTYNVAVTGMTTGGTIIASIAAAVATDAAGNANTASTTSDNTVTWAPGGPSVTINQAAGQADPTSAATINFTVVFSAAVTDFATGDVTITGTAGGTKVATVSGSGTTYNVAVTGMTTSGTVIASVPADVATATSGGGSNAASTSTDNTVTWVAGPSVTINQAAGQADPTSTSPINFTVVFSAPVTGFATGDVTISGTAGGTKVATVTGSGTTYTVAVTGMTTAGTVIATIPAGVAVNAGNQQNIASTSTDNTVTWSGAAATITLSTSAPTPPGAKNPVILWGQGFTLTVQFAMPNGNNRTFQLQGTRDLVTWTTITTLTTDANGRATLFYTPVTNLYYRAVFAGTTDLAAGNSNQVRTVVRQLALLRPTNSGSTKTINRNSSVTFTTTVRPARPELAPARVSFYLFKFTSGQWRQVTKRDVVIDSAGLARTTFTFTSSGQYYVRSQANPTTYNANSVLTPVERYSVR